MRSKSNSTRGAAPERDEYYDGQASATAGDMPTILNSNRQPRSKSANTKIEQTITTLFPAPLPAAVPQMPFARSANTSNNEFENCHNEKKGKKKGAIEPEIPRVEERNAFSISTQLYKFGEHLALYNRLYQETYPQLMCSNTKFYIETENNGVGCLDLLFTAFCDFMKMNKVKNLPTDGGERVFCWLGKRKATEILPTLRPEHHFINRLPLDIYLKDKQSLAFTLIKNTLQKGAQFSEHLCPHIMKRIPCQMLCPHQYARHSMAPCTEPGCFEALSKEARNEMGINKLHSDTMCPCFTSQLFVPETKVFSSSLQQNVFIEDVSRTAPDAHWIVKPSYMRSGKGVRILSSAEQLRTFLKVKTSNRFMWGQDYVVQRYIQNPMLTNTGQKFDIRMFLLIVVTRFKRVLGFLHPGFVRKVPEPYQQLQKDEKFRARRHLAGTRVWRTYGPNPEQPAPPASANNISETDEPSESRNDELNFQNNAKKMKKRKGSVELDPNEPINLVGFYAQDFNQDECEEYNFAVRHGCLKGNKQNLPLILTPTKVPEHNPTPQKKPNVSKATVPPDGAQQPTETASPSVAPSGRASALTTNINAATAPAQGTSTETAGKASATESASATVVRGAAATDPATATDPVVATDPASASAPAGPQEPPPDYDPSAVPPGQDPFPHFSANLEFLRCLRSMVCNICTRITDQIKDRANCYQLFSLDICIDDEGKPWLLEVNSSIITENVNWNSRTVREVIPAVLVESLALVSETTRKSLSFLALRTPPQLYSKPQDLVFRQNFLWLYSTPDKQCDLFELKRLKYAMEKQFKLDLTSRGISYFPVDYHPEKNKHLEKPITSEAAKKTLDHNTSRCTYRFPSPVTNIPVLEEDIMFSTRYSRVPLDVIQRQTRVRHREREVQKQRAMNEEARYKAYHTKKHQLKALIKERFILN